MAGRSDATRTIAGKARLWATLLVCAAIVFTGIGVLIYAKSLSTPEATQVNTMKIVGKNGPERYVDPRLELIGTGLTLGGICATMIFGMLVAKWDAKRDGCKNR